ncbi:MAG: hypothetical protein ACTSUK_02690 [Promethearchaeota archaeon]
MKISINNKIIDRNKKIAQITLYISLAFLAIGFIWTLRNSDNSKSFIGSLILIPAYLLVQVSIFMANRWGKSPRPDEIVIQALKGLDDKYTLYNYTTGVPHLLVGPIGVWIINPYHHEGEISYNSEKKRYKQKGGPKLIAKYFAQEGLPNITREVFSLKKDLKKYFDKNSIHIDEELKVVNLFYSDDVILLSDNAPEINLKSNKLKVFIRNHAKKTKLPPEKIEKFRNLLPKPK